MLTKALQVEMDEDYPTYPVDSRLKEHLEITHKLLRELNLKGKEIWYTKCSTTGHTKDNFPQYISQQDILFVQTKCFCDICQEHGLHETKDCSFNTKNEKAS